MEYITKLVAIRTPMSEITPIVLSQRANQCVAVLAAHLSVLVAMCSIPSLILSFQLFASGCYLASCAPQDSAFLAAALVFLFASFSVLFTARRALAAHVARISSVSSCVSVSIPIKALRAALCGEVYSVWPRMPC